MACIDDVGGAGVGGVDRVCSSERKKDGEACASDAECEGLSCVDTQDLACNERGSNGPGERCWKSADCEQGSYCDENTTCAKATAIGDACQTSAECAPGHCDEAQKCSAPLPLGAACLDDAACTPGSYCDLASTPNKCRARLEPGAPCQADAQCESRFCLTTCDTCPAVCAAVPGNGDPCTPMGTCQEGLACSHDLMWLCQPGRADGMPCDDPSSGATDLGGVCASGTCGQHTATPRCARLRCYF